MDRNNEFAIKLERVRAYLQEHYFHGLLLRSRANFAWLTCGGRSFVSVGEAAGAASLLVTADQCYLLTSNIEAQRLFDEELRGLPIEVVEYPWHQPEAEHELVSKLLSGQPVGVDLGHGGLPVGDQIAQLRAPLTESEIERYVELGTLASRAVEDVCRRIEPGLTELDVAAMVHQALVPHDVRVPVCLVGADQRLITRRHPVPTRMPVERRVMVVVCAEQAGLICSLTRLVSFEPLDSELRQRHRAVSEVAATAIHATRPGRPLSDIFHAIADEYARQGYAQEWQLHHQGGSTGYAGRDIFADPATSARAVVNQAFAWNPSITGTKSEDTVLITDNGFRTISQPGEGWPTVEVTRDRRTYRLADLLVRT